MDFQNAKEDVESVMGLTKDEVEASRRLNGGNELVQNKKNSFLNELLRNFGDPIIKILLIALLVNVVIMFRDFSWYESAGIAVAILISTFVSTISEYGSESAFEKLQQDALQTKCLVKRKEGLIELPINEVVAGDYILLQAGDRIPADGIIRTGNIYVDQSPLNGESSEVNKSSSTMSHSESRLSFDHKECVFRGCVVCSGEAIMHVKKVGSETYYGKLALDIQEEARESPLKLRLGNLAGQISKFGYIGATLVASADLFNSIVISKHFSIPNIVASIQTPKQILAYFIHAATLAISVIVVAIPEGLPLMITVVLSSNMKRMLKDNVLVRKLVGIETSGNLNILFSDKTGTITKGKLEVTTFMNGEGGIYHEFSDFCKTGLGKIVRRSILYNTGATLSRKKQDMVCIGGNATERALLEYIKNYLESDNIKVLSKIPFDSTNKYSCSRIAGEMNVTLLKGAPEIILPNCSYYYDEKGNKVACKNKYELKLKINEMTKQAMRLLAIAISDSPVQSKKDFHDLTLVGIVGIKDDIRQDAIKAISQVTKAGIQVVMITGDNKETAVAIAREAGLLSDGRNGAVITSQEMSQLSDESLRERLSDLRVVARALPSDKSRLIKISQQLGKVVGMTGDGINDAPALKLADVGFAMGSGTEVAKEAGDIVILDDNFQSISKAVLYGRTIFKSIRKFIIFQLTINLCAVGISIIGPFIGINTPLTVLQMLWVNMVMDTLAGLAFAGEAPLLEYMEEKPKDRNEPIINRYMYNQILLSGIYTTILCILFLKLPLFQRLYSRGEGNEILMTAFFALFIFASVCNSFNARTTRIFILANLLKNKIFIIIMILISVVTLLIIYYGGAVLRTTYLTPKELQYVILLAITVIPADIIRKIITDSGWRGSAI